MVSENRIHGHNQKMEGVLSQISKNGMDCPFMVTFVRKLLHNFALSENRNGKQMKWHSCTNYRKRMEK